MQHAKLIDQLQSYSAQWQQENVTLKTSLTKVSIEFSVNSNKKNAKHLIFFLSVYIFMYVYRHITHTQTYIQNTCTYFLGYVMITYMYI